MKAIKFKESDYYSVQLTKGAYLIDGQIVDVETYSPQNIQVKDIQNILPITRKLVTTNYIHIDGEKTLSIEEFEKHKQKLLLKSKIDECGDLLIWETLEDEFEYKVFFRNWIPVQKELQFFGDPISFQIIESQIYTQNEFIKSDYINGGNDPLLFIYLRASAVKQIVTKKFESLGMQFVEGLSHSQTSGKRVWSNSTHSAIRFIVAFGTYIFNDEWDIKFSPRGSLETLISMYDNDKQKLEDIIQTRYDIHFKKIDENSFNFEELLNKLTSCQNLINKKFMVYKNSYSILEHIKQNLSQAILMIRATNDKN